MPHLPSGPARDLIFAALCALGAVLLWLLAATGAFVLGQSGSEIVAQNTSYLQSSSREGLRDMLMIAEILGLLEILSSTEVGLTIIVSVSAEAGQALSALTHIMERMLAVATLATGTAKAMLGLSHLAAAATLGLGLGALGLAVTYFILKAARVHGVLLHICATLMRLMVLLFLTAHLVIPYSINATGWLAGVTSPGDATAVQTMHDNTVKRNTSNDQLKYWSDAKHLNRIYRDTTDDLPQKLSLMTSHFLEKLIHALLIGIVFPLGAGAVMILVIRRMLKGPEADLASLAQQVPRDV